MKKIKKGGKSSSQTRRRTRVVLPKRHEALVYAPLDVHRASAGRQLLVLAVAMAMLFSVVGTFVVLQELSHAEELVDSVRVHQALNAMVVKQMAEEAEQEEVVEEHLEDDEYGESFQ